MMRFLVDSFTAFARRMVHPTGADTGPSILVADAPARAALVASTDRRAIVRSPDVGNDNARGRPVRTPDESGVYLIVRDDAVAAER